MATKETEFDLERLDYATLKKLAEAAAAKADAKRGDELKTLVNGWNMKAEQNGFSVAEVIAEFETYLPAIAAKKTRAPRGTVQKTTPKSEDKEGKLPDLNATYKHPETGEKWTKTGGRAKESFIEMINKGHTWGQMRVK